MRQVLVLVHCQEGFRHRITEDFIEKLVQGTQDRKFDERIHLSASSVLYTDNTAVFHEIREAIDRVIEWDYCEFDPNQDDGDITTYEIDEIFEEIYFYRDAGLERMEKSHWNIPLADRRYIRERYKDNRIMYRDDDYSRQFAWIPEIFRNPSDWDDTRVTLGGLFQDQCVEDVHQLLYWMGISSQIDFDLVSRGIE